MGTRESRWVLGPLHSLLLAIAAILAASCRPPAPPRQEPAGPPPQEPAKPQTEAAMPAWERELREKLEKPVTVEFREASLTEACETLSKLAGVPIRIDPAIGAKSAPITLPKAKMSAEHVLRWICRFNLCRYVFRDGAAVVIPLPSPGELQSQVYDLPGPFAHESVPEWRLTMGPLCTGWCRYIRAVVAPDTWREDLGGNCSGERQGIAVCPGHRLIVVHTEAAQAEVARLLDAHRKMKMGLRVHVLAQFLTIGRAEVEALKLWFQPGTGASAFYAPLRKDQANDLLKAVVEKRRGSTFGSPRLTCHNTQRANVQAIMNPGEVPLLTPEEPREIGAIPDGILLDIQPFIRPDRNQITVIVEGQLHLPRAAVVLLRPDAVVTLPDGGSVLFVLSAPTAGRHEFKDKLLVAVLLTAEVVPDIFEEE